MTSWKQGLGNTGLEKPFNQKRRTACGEEDQMREYERYQFIARGPAADRTLILAGHNVAVPRRMHVARFCTV